MAESPHIAADVMQAAVGPVGASIIALIILMSITGTCNGHLLTAPGPLPTNKDGFFSGPWPGSPRYKTPHVAIVVLAAWGAVITSGTFERAFTFVMFGYWIFMGLAVGGVIVLRKRGPACPGPKAWGYPVTPLLFILAMAFLTVNSLVRTFWNSFAGLGLIAAGIPVYLPREARGKKARALIGEQESSDVNLDLIQTVAFAGVVLFIEIRPLPLDPPSFPVQHPARSWAACWWPSPS